MAWIVEWEKISFARARQNELNPKLFFLKFDASNFEWGGEEGREGGREEGREVEGGREGGKGGEGGWPH